MTGDGGGKDIPGGGGSIGRGDEDGLERDCCICGLVIEP